MTWALKGKPPPKQRKSEIRNQKSERNPKSQIQIELSLGWMLVA